MQALRSMVRFNPPEGEWSPMNIEEDDDPRSNRSSARTVSARSSAGNTGDPESAREAYDDSYNYETAKEGNPSSEENEITNELPLEPLPTNIYGFAMASLIQDSADLEMHQRHCLHSLRALRIGGAMFLSFVMLGMQIFFIMEAKKLVTPRDVAQARKVYGRFEATMYSDNDNVEHTWNTTNGYPRGYKGYFNGTNFGKLSKLDKALVCRVPLSQPFFLCGVLFIWTLTVLCQMRNTINMCVRILNLPTLSSMENAICTKDSGDDEVVGLSFCIKISLVCGVQIPRIMMNLTLLWLGARWLTATLGFGDLFLNALALEFILNLSGLLYEAMVPHNSKLLVQRTLIPHVHKRENENCCNMFGMFSVGILALFLVWAYIVYLQGVLPYYKWDVSGVCKTYLEHQLSL